MNGLVHLHEPEERFDGALSVLNQVANIEELSLLLQSPVRPSQPRQFLALASAVPDNIQYSNRLEHAILDAVDESQMAAKSRTTNQN
jgi:hypothetical protein